MEIIRTAIRRWLHLLLSLLFLGALIVPALVHSQDQIGHAPARPLNPFSSVVILPAVPAGAPGPVIRVGLHIRNIYALSLVDQSFLAEGWYWLEWGDDVQAILDRHEINPENIVELVNEIELGQYSVREVTPPSEGPLRPGSKGLTVRFSGKFYVHDVPQRLAPFDTQPLSIVLEVKPDSIAAGPDRLRLEPLHAPAQISGEDTRLIGYELDRVSWRRAQIDYPFASYKGRRVSRLSAIFEYGKNEGAMFMKWVFPLLIVMAIVILSPSIEGVLADIRIAIPPSALLALVVMQDTYKNSFPPAPYLTYLDELYVYSYIACVAIFLLFLVGTNLVSRAEEQQREAVARLVNRADLVVQASLVFGFVLVAILGWYT
jgi:hypothetical protein